MIIFIKADAKKKMATKSLKNTTYFRNSAHRSGFPLLLKPARPAGGGGNDLWRKRRSRWLGVGSVDVVVSFCRRCSSYADLEFGETYMNLGQAHWPGKK
jgi:hypothetical protein